MMQIIKYFSAQCKSQSDCIKKAKKTPVLKVVQIMAHVWDGAGYGKARGFGKLNKQDLAKRGTDE